MPFFVRRPEQESTQIQRRIQTEKNSNLVLTLLTFSQSVFSLKIFQLTSFTSLNKWERNLQRKINTRKRTFHSIDQRQQLRWQSILFKTYTVLTPLSKVVDKIRFDYYAWKNNVSRECTFHCLHILNCGKQMRFYNALSHSFYSYAFNHDYQTFNFSTVSIKYCVFYWFDQSSVKHDWKDVSLWQCCWRKTYRSQREWPFDS